MDAAEPDRFDLAMGTTLCARLCHDLAGVAGGLAGALEMAATDADPDALSLAADCARDLSARLGLLRVAWGTLGDAAPLATLVAGLPGADRLRVDLAGLADLPDAMHQLAANLLLLAAQSLPRGGAIRLSGGSASLSIQIEGPRAAWPPVLARCMDGAAELRAAAESHRDVGVAVTCLQARALGLSIVIHGPTQLSIASPA